MKIDDGQSLQQGKFKEESLLDFLIILLVVSCAYGILLSKHYAVDTYFCCSHEQVTANLQGGRWLGACIFAMLNCFGIYAGAIQQILTVIHVGLLSFSATLLYRLIRPAKAGFRTQCGLYGIVLITFCNVFYQELFFYSENGLTMGLGALLCVLAIRFTVQIKSIGRAYLAAFVLLSMSLGIYQAFLGIYVPWSLMIIFAQMYKKRATCVKRMLNVVLIGACASALNVLVLKLILSTGIVEGTERQPALSSSHLISRIIDLMRAQKNIWFESYGFLPSGIVLLVIIFALLAVLKARPKIEETLCLLFVILCAVGVVFAPHLLTTDIWLAQRTIFGVFAVVAIALFGAMVMNEKYRPAVTLVTLLFLCINIVQMQRIAENHFATNRLDQESAMSIQKIIDDYEINSGYTVKYIASANDIAPTWSYQGIEYVAFDTNTRAFVVDWADVELLNYYSGRKYTKIQMNNDVYDKNFAQKNWDSFNSEEQIIFDEETMYWIKF